MSKLAKIKNALAKEPKGYRIKNPFTKYYFYNVLQHYRSDINSLYIKSITLLSITVALSAAPVYMLFEILGTSTNILSLIPFLCLLASYGIVIFDIIRILSHNYKIELKVPSEKNHVPFDYQEEHKNELWFLETVRKVSNETVKKYNYLISEYKYSIKNLKKVMVFLLGILVYFTLLKEGYVS